MPTDNSTEDNLDLNRYWPVEPDEVPDLSPILEYVVPYILTARDSGSGTLEALPIAGTPEWQRSSDRVKWAALAVLALEGVKAAERGPIERIAYSEGIARVAAEMNWAGYGYETGYEKGRRDQKAIESRIRRGIERRLTA